MVPGRAPHRPKPFCRWHFPDYVLQPRNRLTASRSRRVPEKRNTRRVHRGSINTRTRLYTGSELRLVLKPLPPPQRRWKCFCLYSS